MKTIHSFCIALAMTFVMTTTQAQNASTEAAVKQLFSDVTKAFNSGDNKHGFSYYTEDAVEISPDGRLTKGRRALTESWDVFLKMTDSKPIFNYSNPSVQVLTPEVAILTFDTDADIKMQGQQIGGKSKGIAFVRKIKGNWLIEGDALIPVLPMPDMTATASVSDNSVFKGIHDKAMSAFATNDVKTLVSLFTDDAVHISPRGEVIKGKEALTKSYTELFKMFSQQPKPDRVTHEMSNESNQFLSPTTFLSNYNEKSTYYYGAKTQVIEEAHSVLLVKKGNDWLIQNLVVTMKGDFPTAVAKN